MVEGRKEGKGREGECVGFLFLKLSDTGRVWLFNTFREEGECVASLIFKEVITNSLL